MILRQRPVKILLSLTFILLVYYLVMAYFQVQDIIKHSPEESTIRINSLSIIDDFSANETIPLTALNSPVTGRDLAGQSLELDQAQLLQIKMYQDSEFLYEQYVFDPSGKVFLVMEFSQLEAGEHNISALWKAPDGKQVNTSRHKISLTRQSSKHRSYFWLKLMKNGIFTEMMTGDEYKGDIHGRWGVEIYLDGTRITTQHFMIFN